MNVLSTRKVTNIMKIINLVILFDVTPKSVNLKKYIWQSLRRINIQIIEVKGLRSWRNMDIKTMKEYGYKNPIAALYCGEY